MKKYLLLILIVISCVREAYSQLPDWSIAPNWTLTDYSGQSHELYDYLNQNKIVVIHFFGTYVPPSFSYIPTLNGFWDQYGPNGSDELMVFSIESDTITDSLDIIGTGANTVGNWANEITHVLIESSSLNSSYDLNYYPTIYAVCPTHRLYEIDTATSILEIFDLCANSGQNSIDDLKNDLFTISPNPFSNNLYLSIAEPNETTEIRVLNSLGQLMASYNEVKSAKFLINTSEYPPGNYYIEAISSTAVSRSPVVKL